MTCFFYYHFHYCHCYRYHHCRYHCQQLYHTSSLVDFILGTVSEVRLICITCKFPLITQKEKLLIKSIYLPPAVLTSSVPPVTDTGQENVSHLTTERGVASTNGSDEPLRPIVYKDGPRVSCDWLRAFYGWSYGREKGSLHNVDRYLSIFSLLFITYHSHKSSL